jgi:hypothetical protein
MTPRDYFFVADGGLAAGLASGKHIIADKAQGKSIAGETGDILLRSKDLELT